MANDLNPETATPAKKTRAEYVAEKIAEVKQKTGMDVIERDLDYARKTGGITALTPFELAVAGVDFDNAANKAPEKLVKWKNVDGYIAARQYASAQEAKAFRQRKAGLTP